jgi:hypothetical protein
LFAEENGLRIDVEYNRDGGGRDIKQNKSQIKIRPDIILHERGSKENNYKNDIIYCEIKKICSVIKQISKKLKNR